MKTIELTKTDNLDSWTEFSKARMRNVRALVNDVEFRRSVAKEAQAQGVTKEQWEDIKMALWMTAANRFLAEEGF